MKNMKTVEQTKRTFRIFAAWDYEFETKEYDRMSEQGWQLVSSGFFSQKYVRDDSVVYRYQLDYHNQIEDMARYDETFRDAGWERVNSTPNGWHIFRKAYDPALSEDAYQIYSDDTSRNDMLRRLRNVLALPLIVLGLNGYSTFRLFDIGQTGFGLALLIFNLLVLFMMLWGMFNVNKLIRGEHKSRPFPMGSFLALLVIACVFLISAAAYTLVLEGSYYALGFMSGMLLMLLVVAVSVIQARKAGNK